MERKKVQSSVLAGVGYDVKTSRLELEFNSGAVWQYHKVPKKVYNEMINSDSLGKFFLAHIKDKYLETRVR